MRLRFLLPALLSIMMNSTMAETKNKFVDQGIPEIQITQAAKDPDAYVIKNVARGKTIIGIGVSQEFQVSKMTLLFDGVGDRIEVNPGETIDIAPGRISVTGTTNGVSGDYSGALIHYGIAFVAFSDGTFYGTKDWHHDLETKAMYRSKFIQEAVASGNPEQFMRDQAALLQSRESHTNSGMTSEERVARYDALVDWQAVNQVFDEKIDVFMKLHQERTTKFPKLKVVKYLDSLNETPKDNQDGWWAFSWVMNCFNGSPGYQGSKAIQFDAQAGFYGYGCSFPYPDPAPVPNGIVNSVNLIGTQANFSASCDRNRAGAGLGPGPSIGNYIRDDGFTTLRILPGADPLLVTYAPRQRIYTNINANFDVDANAGHGPDTFYANFLVGIIEPFLPSANADFGFTQCKVDWWLNNAPILAREDALMTNDPITGAGPMYTLAIGQVPTYYSGTYRYVLINRKQVLFCNPDKYTPLGRFPGVIPKVGPPNSTANVVCTHTPPPAGDDGGGEECDGTDWCCCMWETAQNYYTCLSRGLWPSDFCPMSGSSAPAYITNESKTGTTVSRESATARLGLFRNNGTPGGSALSDPAGLGAYDPLVTNETTTFVIPGGVQSTDKAVAGDWTGSGHASIGIYRPSTGQWFLDANGNGVWDGTVGGDFQYQFGGVQPTGTPGQSGYIPGDMPVVGDWNGNGRDCVGVFRWGHTWVIDLNCNGMWDGTGYINSDGQFEFGGVTGDVPVVGKWRAPRANNNIVSSVGVVRCYIPSGGTQCQGAPFYWVLDYGAPFEKQDGHGVGLGPIDCGISFQLQAYYSWAKCETPSPYAFGGLFGDVYVTGDWNGEGKSRPGIYRSGQWLLSLDDNLTTTATYWFGGLPVDSPLPGKW